LGTPDEHIAGAQGIVVLPVYSNDEPPAYIDVMEAGRRMSGEIEEV
jgi:hypothetical protein